MLQKMKSFEILQNHKLSVHENYSKKKIGQQNKNKKISKKSLRK